MIIVCHHVSPLHAHAKNVDAFSLVRERCGAEATRFFQTFSGRNIATCSKHARVVEQTCAPINQEEYVLLEVLIS